VVGRTVVVEVVVAAVVDVVDVVEVVDGRASGLAVVGDADGMVDEDELVVA
jgi:hypothetical protein